MFRITFNIIIIIFIIVQVKNITWSQPLLYALFGLLIIMKHPFNILK